jgi:hypothetical protein
MKRILATGSIAALTVLGFAGTANAAPADAACFGQVHKLVNSGALGVDNVGQFVQTFENKGRGKNAEASAVDCSTL